MKISILWVGKTQFEYLKEGISEYEKRIRNIQPFSVIEIPEIRKGGALPKEMLKQAEGEQILSRLSPSDEVWLMDERGQEYTSSGFSGFLEKKMCSGVKNLVLVIGGAYGFSDAVYARCQGKISLSQMTFSHQMIRLFLTEQIYRALSILRGEPYHHE